MNKFEHVTTIPQLIEVAHAMAVEKQWWPDGPQGRSVAEQVNGFAYEVSSAWSEYRAGRMELWWSIDGEPVDINTWVAFTPLEGDEIKVYPGHDPGKEPKPECFFVELADLVIRLCDTSGAYGWAINLDSGLSTSNIPHLVAWLNKNVAGMFWLPTISGAWSTDDEMVEAADVTASFIIASCFASAEQCGVDLWPLIRLKLAYNAKRPERHGCNRA